MSSMDSDQEIISTHNLNKKFGGIVVAKNVNFSVNKGELRCLIGPNGAGKSTLFSLLCGIEKADSGQITILNKNVKAANFNIDTINQKTYVFGIAHNENEKKEVIQEAKQIVDLKEIVTSILMVSDLSRQKE